MSSCPDKKGRYDQLRVENIRLETEVGEMADVPVLKVAGEIDVYTAPELRAAINEAIGSGATDLIIDLTDVGYMDSSGFGMLLGAAKRVKPKGGTINLVGCSEAVGRMLSITRLDTVFGVFSEVKQAVESTKAGK